MDDKHISKDVEEFSLLNVKYYPNTRLQELRKNTKISFRIIGVSIQVRRGKHLKAIYKLYRLSHCVLFLIVVL